MDFISGNTSMCRFNRMKFSDSSINVTEKDMKTIDYNDIHYNNVEKVVNLRLN